MPVVVIAEPLMLWMFLGLIVQIQRSHHNWEICDGCASVEVELDLGLYHHCVFRVDSAGFMLVVVLHY